MCNVKIFWKDVSRLKIRPPFAPPFRSWDSMMFKLFKIWVRQKPPHGLGSYAAECPNLMRRFAKMASIWAPETPVSAFIWKTSLCVKIGKILWWRAAALEGGVVRVTGRGLLGWLGQEDWLCWCGRGVRFYVGWCQFCSNTLWQLIKKVFSLLNITWTTLVLHAFFFARITGRTNFLDCCCCCFAAIPFSLGLLLHGLATRHPCKLANSAHTFEIQTGSGWGPVVITGVSRQQWMNFRPLPSPLFTVNPFIVIVCI